MITLRSRGAPRRSLSAQHTTLSVSWLRKQFRAVAIHRGQIAGTWESPEPVEGTDHFPELLHKAVEATGYHGSTVTLVLAHQHLVHLLIEVPPVKRNLLARVVNRQAQQQRLFPGEAVWSIEPAETPPKSPPQFLLNLFPKLLLEDLVRGCAKLGLYLTAVIPVPAVLRSQLFEIPMPESQAVMVAACTGDATTVLVGRSDGRVILSRVLSGNWQDSLPRLLVDLKRTMLFVNQQDGVNVESLWLFGPDAAEKTGAIQDQLGIPTRVSPTPWSEDYWAIECVRLEDAHSQNFISPEQRKAPQRRVLATVLAVTTVAVFLISALVSWKLLAMAREEVRAVQRLEQEAARLQTRHQELQLLHADIARRRQIVELVADGRPAPVPAWVMGYLGEALPADLVVTNLSVQRDGAQWRVEISGRPQPGREGTNTGPQLAAYAEFTNRLVSGPFHLRLQPPDGPAGAETTTAGAGAATNAGPMSIASWLARLSAPRTAAPTNVSASFVVEGWVQP